MKPFVRKLLPFVAAGLSLALLVPAAVVSFERQQSIGEARDATVLAEEAVGDYWDARFALADTLSRASGLAPIATLLAGVAGGVEAAESTALLDELDALATFTATGDARHPVEGEPGTFPVVTENLNTDAARAATKTAERGATAWDAAASQVRQLEQDLAARIATAEASWVATAESAPAAAKALIAANASATPNHQTATTDAAAAFAKLPADREAAFAAYAKAIAGLKQSHIDEQARIAAEAAAAARKKKRTPSVVDLFGGRIPVCIKVDSVTREPWREEWTFDGIHIPACEIGWE